MLSCLLTSGEKINLINHLIKKDELKKLSSSNQLICQECLESLVYCHGEKNVPHFKHKRKNNCVLSLGESEEHKKGKIMIYNWLKKTRPNDFVDIEYKIVETNQRADVICISNNNKYVFEIQLSKINHETWAERHELYKSADVYDFWLFGNKMLQLTNQFRNLEFKKLYASKKIDNELGYIYGIDVNSESLYLLHKELELLHLNEYDKSARSDISEVFIHQDYKLMSTSSIKAIEQIKTDNIRSTKMAMTQTALNQISIVARKRSLEEFKKQLQISVEEDLLKSRRRNLEYINLLFSNKELDYVIKKGLQFEGEKKFMQHLMSELNINTGNFPPFCMLITDNSSIIKTPPHLWQLALLNNFILLHTSKRLSIDDMCIYLRTLEEENKLRFNDGPVTNQGIKSVLKEYIDILTNINILSFQTLEGNRFYRVNLKKLPLYESSLLNNSVAASLSLKNFSLHRDYAKHNDKINEKNLKTFLDFLDVHTRSQPYREYIKRGNKNGRWEQDIFETFEVIEGICKKIKVEDKEFDRLFNKFSQTFYLENEDINYLANFQQELEKNYKLYYTGPSFKKKYI